MEPGRRTPRGDYSAGPGGHSAGAQGAGGRFDGRRMGSGGPGRGGPAPGAGSRGDADQRRGGGAAQERGPSGTG